MSAITTTAISSTLPAKGIHNNPFLGETTLKLSEITLSLTLKSRVLIQACKMQQIIPSLCASIRLSGKVTSFQNAFPKLGGVLGCLTYYLNILQKARFIEGLKNFNTLAPAQKEAFLAFIKTPGILEKILSTEFCNTHNIYIDSFTTKIPLMIQQAEQKKIMDKVGLVISLFFLATCATPLPMWAIYTLSFVTFATKHIFEKQFIDNTTQSLNHFYPGFIKNLSAKEALLPIENLASGFTDNRARFWHLLPDANNRYLDEQKPQLTKPKFSQLLRNMLYSKAEEEKMEIVGRALLAVGSGLSLISAPALKPLSFTVLLFGLALRSYSFWPSLRASS